MSRSLAMVLVVMLLSVNPIASGESRDPGLDLRPHAGPPGTIVVVLGRDFPTGAHGTIAWGVLSRSFGEFRADADGNFEITITIPDLPPGDYEVAAISASAHTVPTATFTILPPAEDQQAIATPAASPASPSGTPLP